MAGTAFGLPEILGLNDPQIAVDQQALQRRMAMAQALREQSMTPVNTSNRMVGNMAYRVSPLEGIAKIVQAMQANRQDTANDADRMEMAQRMGAALKSMAGDGAPVQPQEAAASQGSGFAPSQNFAGANPDYTPAIAQTVANAQPSPQPTVQAAPKANAFGMANLLRSMSIGALGGDAAQSAFWKNQEVPDSVKASDLYGQDRGVMGALNTQKLRKEATNPTPLGRTHYIDTDGQIKPLPQQIPGQVDVPDATAPGGFKYVPSSGGLEGLRSAADIPAQAQAGVTNTQVWDPTANGGKGGMVFRTAAQIAAAGTPPSSPTTTPQQQAAALRAPPVTSNGTSFSTTPSGAPVSQVPPAIQAARDDPRRAILSDELKTETDPVNRAKIQAELLRVGAKPGANPGPIAPPQPYAAAPPPGAVTEADAAATNRQATMKDEFTKVSGQASTAQDLISKLQSIKQLAPGATLGPGTERRDLLNGWLGLAGFSAAKDAATASSMVDQHAGDIAKIMGGDQAKTEAALKSLTNNPRSSLNPGQAADALIAPLQVFQAKAGLLTPHFIAGDAGSFLTKKQQFDDAADPRIWEWRNIQDPQARAEFAKSLAAQDPTIMDKMNKLEALGIKLQ
jgi:hypothetical protein